MGYEWDEAGVVFRIFLFKLKINNVLAVEDVSASVFFLSKNV